MKRLLIILVFLGLNVTVFAQEETRIIDSLQDVLATQEGRDKVLTMIELTWDFHDFSYDDCLDWGERAIKEAQTLGYSDLEAKANYVLGIQYAYHGDLELAKEYLQTSYIQFMKLDDLSNAFEALWNIATYEFTLGSIDTAYQVYEKAEVVAEQLNDTSAWAFVISNKAMILYYKGELEEAYDDFIEAERLFRSIGDDLRTARMESSLATLLVDKGQVVEAKNLFRKVIPVFEEFGDNYHLLGVYKNLGHIFEYELVNYDSAMYFLQQALDYSNMSALNKSSEVLANNEKSNVISEMANIMVCQGDFKGAIERYEEALRLAESNAYLHGQQTACQALGKVYSQLGQASKSLHYFQRYMQLEDASGITNMRSLIRVPLMMDYARLDRFDDMQKELETFEEEYAALMRENADIYEQNRNLKYDAEHLLRQYESQNRQIADLQTLCKHYRLAFFGLLAIMLSALVLFVSYKIVWKNKTKK